METKYFDKNKFLRISTILLFFILVGNFQNTIFGMTYPDLNSDTAKAENIQYAIHDQKVIINYNLIGNSKQSYNVQLMLKKESNPNYQFIPDWVSGNIGKGQTAGNNKQIVWDIGDEIPGGLKGNDYYFEINVKKINNNSGFLSWIGIGVAAVTATVTYLILSNTSSSGNSAKQVSSQLSPSKP